MRLKGARENQSCPHTRSFHPTVVRLKGIIATLTSFRREAFPSHCGAIKRHPMVAAYARMITRFPSHCGAIKSTRCQLLDRHPSPGFHPTVVRLKAVSKWIPNLSRTSFPSHCGAIKSRSVDSSTNSGPIGFHPTVVRLKGEVWLVGFGDNENVSIPLWCD